MPHYPKPHTPEWFEALQAFNPHQAAMTRQMIDLAGSDDVCSICGDDPAAAYKLQGSLPADAVGTLRLCDDCKQIRAAGYGEAFEPLT